MITSAPSRWRWLPEPWNEATWGLPRPLPAMPEARSPVFRPYRFLCLPGLVPDGPETFLRQQRLFARHGVVETLTYPGQAFDLAALLSQVAAVIRGSTRPVVLVGVSVGGGIAIEALRRGVESGSPLSIAGLILISPCPSVADLAPALVRFLPAQADAAGFDGLERGRAFFRLLARRSTVQVPQTPWRRWLTPTGWQAMHDAPILRRITGTLEGIPADGAMARALALHDLRGLQGFAGPLTTAPSLVLWGSRERHTLRMDGPDTAILSSPDRLAPWLPEAEVHWVYDRHGETVPHASLLRHAAAFNPHLRRFCRRLGRRR